MESLKDLISNKASKRNLSSKTSTKWLSNKEIKELNTTSDNFSIANEINSKKQKLESDRIKQISDLILSKKSRLKRKADFENEISNSYNDSNQNSIKNVSEKEKLQPTLSKQEVIRILRKLREPITFFGETDIERFNRMYQLQFEKNDDELRQGKQNLVIDSLSGRDKGNTDHHDDDEDDLNYTNIHSSSSRKDAEKSHYKTFSTSNISISYENSFNLNSFNDQTINLTPSERVRNWIKHLLRDWEEELHSRTDEEAKSAEGKMASGMHRQTRKDLKPLIKKLKTNSLEPDVLEKLAKMVDLCINRQYRDAHDIYMLLSIGNAAWPMGVTMVGIHERAGRSKIFTSEVAHILNDETTRKYIQMFKRLMSFSQRKYPADPSQMVKIATVNV